MAGAFVDIDLTKLPKPDVVQALDFEVILAEMLADLRARDPAFTATVESDPAYKILEAAAYRELLLRQQVNDAAHAVMLAYAVGTDLDQIGANFSIERLVIDAGDPSASPPVASTLEGDAAFRRRIQISFEGFSTAGPEGAYLFHALGADPDVLDASVESPVPGDVVVTVLSRSGDGTPTPTLVESVAAVLAADDVRPLTDNVIVQAADVVLFSVDAELTLYPGPDSSLVKAQALAGVDAYVTEQHRLGRDVSRSGLFAALHQPGVQNVELTAPSADLVISSAQAPYCTGTSIIVVGTDV